MLKGILTAGIIIIWSFSGNSQITQQQLKEYVTITIHSPGYLLKNKEGTAVFYYKLDYKTAWLQTNSNNLQQLLLLLQEAEVYALRQDEYKTAIIKAYLTNSLHLNNIQDSLEAEIAITDVALHFFKDFFYGNTTPVLSYYGLTYSPDCYNLPAMLASYAASNSINRFINHTPGTLKEITALEAKVKSFSAIMRRTDFKETVITSSKITTENKPLLVKLQQLCILDSAVKNLNDSILKLKVKEAQQEFVLPVDGVLRSATLQQLNVPLQVRLQQLSLSVNYYRWLQCLTQQQEVIVVNIPAAYLKVYDGNKIILEMRMIVGKKSTPTPTLSSVVNEVILYPYWHVPHKIATQELLPYIRRNPGFINAGNYQVLNYTGKIVDPYSVNWQALSSSYFPYVIRQSTGCDNALGLLKLNFYNPFTVYLHDTPGKDLFKRNSRFFSHGCMRMQKPMELGHMVLKNNRVAIDTLEEKGCIRNQAPVVVHADVHMPVIVWYNPAGIDSTGRVLFFEDVYHKFSWMRK